MPPFGGPSSYPGGGPSSYPGGPSSPFAPGGPGPFAPGGPGVGTFPKGPTATPSQSFLSLFGSADLSLQEIADKAHQLQHKIDENAEQEKASLRTAAEQKHLEIERHAAELARHAASSIEAYKTVQLQTAERQKAYQQAVVRQQADQAKRLIDQQAAQAIAAVETRDRQLTLQRQQQELVQRGAPQYLGALGGPLPGGPPLAGPSTPLPGQPPPGMQDPMGFPTMPPGQAPRIDTPGGGRGNYPDSMQVRPFGSMASPNQMPPAGVSSMHELPPRPGSPMPGGPMPGGPMPGGPMPGGSMFGGSMPGGSMPGGPMPGGSMLSGSMPGGPLGF